MESGKDASLPEESKTMGTELELSGMQFDRGYLRPTL